MDIQHASLAQVRKGRDGRQVLIEGDVLDIVSQVKHIDPRLSVHWNEYGEYFVVTETSPTDGRERLVTTVLELDQNLVRHLERLGSAEYDYVAEVERKDDKAKADKKWKFAQEIGETGERLAHALRKDLQAQNRIFIPQSIVRV